MPEPDDLRSHDLSVLSEQSARDLDSAEGILGLLTGWAAERLRLAREAAEPEPEAVARWTAENERYAELLRRVKKLTPDELRRVVEELGPVARRAVEEGR
ncbi:hypothetical protein [Streptomyces sp. NBC_00391]|uniref:hypothetical protein n=1 Tax=Streptomyces sp. NBC_00391 TaxID=2903647 RepID=UPI002E1CBF4F